MLCTSLSSENILICIALYCQISTTDLHACLPNMIIPTSHARNHAVCYSGKRCLTIGHHYGRPRKGQNSSGQHQGTTVQNLRGTIPIVHSAKVATRATIPSQIQAGQPPLHQCMPPSQKTLSHSPPARPHPTHPPTACRCCSEEAPGSRASELARAPAG